MKFAKQYLETIEGIEIYPIFSLIIFFTFFALLIWWVFTAKKEYINEVKDLPFDNKNKES
jgi:cbb3-type cytochrome oxidase subunit 3